MIQPSSHECKTKFSLMWNLLFYLRCCFHDWKQLCNNSDSYDIFLKQSYSVMWLLSWLRRLIRGSLNLIIRFSSRLMIDSACLCSVCWQPIYEANSNSFWLLPCFFPYRRVLSQEIAPVWTNCNIPNDLPFRWWTITLGELKTACIEFCQAVGRLME